MDEIAPSSDSTFSHLRIAFSRHSALLFVTFIVAACSIMYEVLIAHSLAFLAANAVIWYSVVIGFYLLGMGLGSLLVDVFYKNDRNPWSQLCLIELLLSIAGFLAIPVIYSAHSLYGFCDFHNYFNLGLVVFFGVTLSYTLLVGVLTGIELPLLIRAGKIASKDENLTNIVLGVDYLGSLVGAILFPLLLLPYFPPLTLGTFVASINLMVALIILIRYSDRLSVNRVFYTSMASVCVVFFSLALFFGSAVEQFYLKRYYCYRLLSRSLTHFLSLGEEYPDIIRVRSPYQMIDFIHDLEGDGTDSFVEAYSDKFTRNPRWPHNYLLFLNGDWQFHSNHEEVYHEYFAHVPIISTNKVPKNVLVLGGGDGLLIRELLRYPEIEVITHVDLDPRLIEFAKSNKTMLTLNNSALFDPRIKAVFDDGMQFVRTTKERYDAIYIDFPTPTDYNLSRLYSREFYFFVRKCLQKNGFIVFDSVSTGSLLAPNENGIQKPRDNNHWARYYATLRAAGFTRVVPYNSTLGFNSARARELAREQYSESEANNRTRNYVLQRQQGFIMAGMPGTLFGAPYKKPPGPELYSLTEERYYWAFEVKYPETAEVDYSKVNSIFRPLFPILPIWNARLPF